MSQALFTLQEWLFPPLCLHCQERLPSLKRLFCDACAVFFELEDPRERCLFCFEKKQYKHRCQHDVDMRLAYVFEAERPILSLAKQLKAYPYLIPTVGDFMLIQLSRLRWSQFDVIFPCTTWKGFKKDSVSFLLASYLAKRLDAQQKKRIALSTIESKNLLMVAVEGEKKTFLQKTSYLLEQGAESVHTLCFINDP